MEIGPVEAVRLVGKVLSSRPQSAPDRVFAAEFRRQDQDPSQTLSRRASRGLEDETPDDDPEDQPTAPTSTVNLFA